MEGDILHSVDSQVREHIPDFLQSSNTPKGTHSPKQICKSAILSQEVLSLLIEKKMDGSDFELASQTDSLYLRSIKSKYHFCIGVTIWNASDASKPPRKIITDPQISSKLRLHPHLFGNSQISRNCVSRVTRVFWTFPKTFWTLPKVSLSSMSYYLRR